MGPRLRGDTAARAYPTITLRTGLVRGKQGAAMKGVSMRGEDFAFVC